MTSQVRGQHNAREAWSMGTLKLSSPQRAAPEMNRDKMSPPFITRMKSTHRSVVVTELSSRGEQNFKTYQQILTHIAKIKNKKNLKKSSRYLIGM